MSPRLFHRPDHSLRQAIRSKGAILHARPWWVALGQATPQGYRLGGEALRAWTTPDEYRRWLWWRPGRGLDAKPLPHAMPPWLSCVTQPFYEFLQGDIGWQHWDDPRWNTGARLRWVQTWPVHNGAAWDPTGSLRVPIIPALRPWMEILTPDVPVSFGAWYLDQATADRVRALPTPWALVVLQHCMMLQAMGAGYFDEASASSRPAEGF